MSTPDASQAETPAPELTAPALRQLALTVATVCAVFAATYAMPALQRYRPLVSGEGVPIVRMFVGQDAEAALPAFAEAGALSTPPTGGRGADDEAEVAAAAAAARSEEEEAVADGEDGNGPRAAHARVRISPSEYEGLTQPIENPDVLKRFFSALRRSAQDVPGAITRVAHYGDSAVAADQITRTLRRRLQVRFGDAGHGFVLVSRGDMHYGHRDIKHRASDGWEMHSLVRDTLRGGYYGYGGVVGNGRPGEYSHFSTMDDGPIGTAFGSVELFYQRHRHGGTISMGVDDGESRTIDTRAAEVGDAWERIELAADGPHSLSIRTRGRGESHIYGVAFERNVPGVVYDSLGLVGARAQRLLNADAAHMQRQIAHRAPDLLVLGFGGNEAGNSWLDVDRYAEELREVVRVMRAGRPEMDCLLFGPLDQGEVNKRGDIVTLEKLPGIVEAQRRVSAELGCAFFDTYAAMGGEHSVRAWYKRRPRLVTSDYRHATPAGYEVVGKLYYKALLKAFADYLAASRQ